MLCTVCAVIMGVSCNGGDSMDPAVATAPTSAATRDAESVVDFGVDHGVDRLAALPRRRRQARDSSWRLSSSPARGALGKVRLVSGCQCGEERALAPRANLCDARCARVAC